MHAMLAGQALNKDYYCIFLQNQLCPAMPHKHPVLLQNYRFTCYRIIMVLPDNASCQVTNNVILLLQRCQWEILKHLPYSTDMNPSDFDCFRNQRYLSEAAYFMTFHLYYAQYGATPLKSIVSTLPMVSNGFSTFDKRL
ncbi:hypothetical protein TNCV_5060231 [Trichonephila clavipes]|nr:hypothetical protein TNCV_5060231 [Trichonephila clavipes]